MVSELPGWHGRRKRFLRRLARDLRVSMPGLGLVLCFASAAWVITVAEASPVADSRVPLAFEDAFEGLASKGVRSASREARESGELPHVSASQQASRSATPAGPSVSELEGEMAENGALSASTPRFRSARPRR